MIILDLLFFLRLFCLLWAFCRFIWIWGLFFYLFKCAVKILMEKTFINWSILSSTYALNSIQSSVQEMEVIIMKRNTRHTKSLQTRHRNRLRPSGALCNISCVLFWIGEYWVSSDPSSCRIGIPTEPDITREASVDAAAFLGMKIHCNISGNERYALEPWNTSRSPHHVLAL